MASWTRRCGSLILLLAMTVAVHATPDDPSQDEEEEGGGGGGTIDEIIAAAGQKPSSMDLLFDLSGNNFLVDMDMLLTKPQIDALQILNDESGKSYPARTKRKAIKALSYRWKSNTIPYKIARGVFSSRDLRQIDLGIKQWRDHTCLNFREATGSDRNRIYIDNGQGCYSYVGMTGGSQKVGLAPGCRYEGVVAHELGHAVGFHHEQNRPDRDDYVRIVRSNIPSNLYYNFKKYPWSAVTTHDVPYDYGSVMHYGGTAFSTNGQYTIRTINPADQNKIGNRKGLSFFDIKLANIMYSCNARCATKLKCPGHGFQGKDCKCMCPGNPVRPCSGTEVTTKRPTTGGSTRGPGSTTTRRPTKCRDQNRYCKAWAQAGYCGRNSYVKTYCKLSCNLCGGSTSSKGACKDLRPHCDVWNSRGYCKGQYAVFMSENCAKTCKACTPRSEGGTDEMEAGGRAPALRYQLATLMTSVVVLLFAGSLVTRV